MRCPPQERVEGQFSGYLSLMIEPGFHPSVRLRASYEHQQKSRPAHGSFSLRTSLLIPDRHGEYIVVSPGASGTGTITGIVIKGLAPGTGTLSIVQVSAKDSQQQRPIRLVTNQATVQVEP
jgi:hypothetical protein